MNRHERRFQDLTISQSPAKASEDFRSSAIRRINARVNQASAFTEKNHLGRSSFGAGADGRGTIS